MTFFTVIDPVAFDAYLVGFLIPTTGSFREGFKGDVTAGGRGLVAMSSAL